MNRDEAAVLLRDVLATFRCMRHAELVRLIGDVQVSEVTGESGETYTIEVDVMWDARPDGDVRVMGAIDDGRLPGAMSPLCEDFLITPGGEIV